MKSINRIIIYICGIFLLALGGVLAIKSNLGASPVSSLPLSISKVSSISLGTAAAILFTIYVGMQIILLKRDFKMIQLLQIVFAILFGQIMNFFNLIIISIIISNFFFISISQRVIRTNTKLRLIDSNSICIKLSVITNRV